jgi:hypothetical protein
MRRELYAGFERDFGDGLAVPCHTAATVGSR